MCGVRSRRSIILLGGAPRRLLEDRLINRLGLTHIRFSTRTTRGETMSGRRNRSRLKVAALAGEIGYAVLQTGTFDLSDKFKNGVYDEDEETPLDCVSFDKVTGRYQVSDRECGFTNDDAILQALIMLWLLGRVARGWSLEATANQLSVWTKTKKRKRDDDDDGKDRLENLWKKEIELLQGEKKLGKNIFGHPDNFDAIRRIFSIMPAGDRWDRRSNTGLGRMHEIAEQATIQWALKNGETDRYMVSTASLLVKIHCQHGTDPAAELRVGKCLCYFIYHVSKRDDDATFCKVVLNLLGRCDWNHLAVHDQDDIGQLYVDLLNDN